MVAYSFKARFADPILAGEKRQTIRGARKRHARPGEELQLYTGMRTRQCRLIGHAICEAVEQIRIEIDEGVIYFPRSTDHIRSQGDLDFFAVRDGFEDWADMQRFWRREHPDTVGFAGVLITWSQFLPRAVP